jgi:VIT1/CCC1 family predicted Fe2+/Mn2+ transporter
MQLLTAASGVAFLVGVCFPILVLLDPGPSAWAYMVVLVSLHVWALGFLTGGLAGYLASRAGERGSRLRRLAWLLSALNFAAILICLVWNPPGIS